MDMDILSNFAIVTSVLTLTSALLGLNLTLTRYVVIATVYAVFFAWFSFYDWTFVAMSLFVSVCASYDYGVGTMVLYVLTYVSISTALELLARKLSTVFSGDSIPSLIIAMSIVVLTGIVSLLLKLLKTHRNKTSNTYQIEIIYNNQQYFSQGFYDSGNSAREDGLPIVILPQEVANKIDFSPTDYTQVMTVAGVKTVATAPMDIKVYFEDGSHIVYAVLGATSHFYNQSSVILNAEMRR